MKPEEPHGVRDPGKPTWQEVVDGFEAFQFEAGQRVRLTLEALEDQPRPLIDSEKGTPARVGAENAFSEASATFSHWLNAKRRAEAFIKVHPDMRESKIDAECKHRNRCWVGDGDGFYRLPMRDMGDHDDEQ